MRNQFFKSWATAFRSYFTYTRSERNGLLILSALSALILCVPVLWSFVAAPEKEADAAQLALFAEKVAAIDVGASDASDKNVFVNSEIKSELSTFNPNTASLEELLQIGFSPKVARTLINYRSKGGQFRKATDLKRIYGLSETEYNRFLPFVSLEPTVPKTETAEHRPPQYLGAKNENWAWNLQLFDPNAATESELLALGFPKQIVKIMSNFKKSGGIFRKKEDLKKIYGLTEEIYGKVESYVQIADNQGKKNADFPKSTLSYPSAKLNLASSPINLNKATEDELMKVPRIGRTFAARITEYRNRLGGFSRPEQLKEVYGMPDSTYQNILPFCKIESISIKKINVNSIASADDCRHPYLTRKQLEVLVRYRINHGNYMNIKDLARTGVFSTENLQALLPYLSFE
ncbi:MAG: hypothetical protein RL757_2170 [Bacteroidota bacterium]